MRRMSLGRERRILEKMANGNYDVLGWGSTRITFAISDRLVAKITVDADFIGQNDNEIEIAKEDKGKYTARIYAYGTRIILAERVEPIDASDLRYKLENREEYTHTEKDLEILERQVLEAEAVGDYLRDMNTDSDGEQYGITADGTVVSYDYGYSDDCDHYSMVGGIDDCYNNEDAIELVACIAL